MSAQSSNWIGENSPGKDHSLAHADTWGALGSSLAGSLARSWPQLVTLELANAALSRIEIPSAPSTLNGLASLSRLRSVRIDGSYSATAFVRFLHSLPPTLTALALNDSELYSAPAFAEAVRASAPTHAPHLRELTLLGLHDDTWYDEVTVERGVFENVVSRLGAVRRLAISPCAVTDLATALAPLSNLADLAVRSG